MAALTTKGSLAAVVLAAIGASLCCVGPLVLLSLGVGGAWIGNLTALEPYRPIFIGVTLLFLGLAYRQLYLAPQVCAPGAECTNPQAIKRQRLVFWVVAHCCWACWRALGGTTVLVKESNMRRLLIGALLAAPLVALAASPQTVVLDV